jgi:enhancer of yellow 2 transcription factor
MNPEGFDRLMDLNGNKTVLKDLLKQRLIECSWEDKVRLLCQEEIKKKNGKITADEMFDAVKNPARHLVPGKLFGLLWNIPSFN